MRLTINAINEKCHFNRNIPWEFAPVVQERPIVLNGTDCPHMSIVAWGSSRHLRSCCRWDSHWFTSESSKTEIAALLTGEQVREVSGLLLPETQICIFKESAIDFPALENEGIDLNVCSILSNRLPINIRHLILRKQSAERH